MTGAIAFSGRIRAAAATVAVVVLALTACTPDGAPPVQDVSPTSAPTSASGASPASSPDVSPAPSPVPTGPTLLRDLRIGRHDGFDRLVLEFTAGVPPFQVRAATGPIRDCGAGADVTGPGSFLLVRAESVAQVDADGRPAYTGPRTVTGPGRAIAKAVITCDFEGQLEVAIAVTGSGGHTDSTLTAPGRIVVDVRD